MKLKKALAALLFGGVCVFGSQAAIAAPAHPFAVAQPDSVPEEAYVAIEIPAGSMTKYEINDDGYIFVDRYQSMPVVYPANYGSLPSTLGGDGDPLDALVFSREPIVPGAFIKIRPVGFLKMIDGGEDDEKIIAVPASDIDPTYDNIQDIDDISEIELARIEAFFRVYKQLPDPNKKVELQGYGNAAEAKEMLQKAIDAYKAAN
ncbi:MAG: inorganic diphosphatase [Alcaligenaceae bacterium]|nr:inorganic diphosphatase [Alcaligenaceae bacterium]